MGHGAELKSKEKRLHDKYVSNEYGLELLLNDFYSVSEMGFYSSDTSAINIKIDFEEALTSELLNSEQRASLAFMYGLQLSFVQTSRLLKMKVSEVKESIEEAMENLEAILHGYPTKFKKVNKSKAVNITEWIHEVSNGEISIFDVTEEVNTALLHYLENNRDKLAIETLHQRVHGKPEIKDTDEEQYPYHSDSYFLDQDRHNKVSYKEDFSSTSKGSKASGKKLKR